MKPLSRLGWCCLAIVGSLIALAAPRSHAQGILDFVSFDGIDYLRWAEEPGRPLGWDDLGVEFARMLARYLGE